MGNLYYINTCTCTCTYTRIIQICIHYLHIYICTQIHIYTDIATDLHILCDSNPWFLHGHSSSASILASKFCKYMFQQIVMDDQPITQETTCRTIHVYVYIYIHIYVSTHCG